MAARELPGGTVTLLFTDIEGSTRLLQELGREAYVLALTAHRRLLREAVTAHGGVEVEMQGDSFHFAFPVAGDALAAAVAAQRALHEHEWDSQPLRARVGLHSGEPMQADGLYAGLEVHIAARVMSAGHGGQVLVSQRTAELVGGDVPERVSLVALGDHVLKDLLAPQRLYQVVVDELPAEFPPLNTLARRVTNLPVQPSRLIGRTAELAALLELLRDGTTRLVTLTGPGGTGKTRLALQAGAELVDAFADGVFFVPLSAVRESSLVLGTVATTLGAREETGTSEEATLAAFLHEKRVLLVLDNFEQVIGAAPDVSRLLSNAPGLKVLVTSREPLRIAGEWLSPVEPLSLPHGASTDASAILASDSVALFVERATAASRAFSVTDANASRIGSICVRLDGLPLAIELAAARVGVLSLEALSSRLDQRLELLTSGPRDADERQRTLRATIEWSYDLLDESEKRLFAGASAFAGGCRVEAAEAVCDPDRSLGIDVFEGLCSLLSKNLLRRRDDADGEPRFWMLETIREFGLERAADSHQVDVLHRRHAEWLLELARRADRDRYDAADADWLSRLAAEQLNLHDVLERSRVAWPEILIELPGLLWRYWYLHRRLREGRGWVEEALELQGGASTREREKLLAGAYSLTALLGDRAAAREWGEERLAVARELDDKLSLARSLSMLATATAHEGDLDRAVELAEESVRICRTHVEAAPALENTVHNLGYVREVAGHTQQAREAYAEALDSARRRGSTIRVASELGSLGSVEFYDGHLERARSLLLEGLQLELELHSSNDTEVSFVMLAAIAASQGRVQQAARLLGFAAENRERTAEVLAPHHERTFAAARATVTERLSEQELQALWAEGRAMTHDEALALACLA